MSKNEGNQKLKFFKPFDLARNASYIYRVRFTENLFYIFISLTPSYDIKYWLRENLTICFTQ